MAFRTKRQQLTLSLILAILIIGILYFYGNKVSCFRNILCTAKSCSVQKRKNHNLLEADEWMKEIVSDIILHKQEHNI